MAKRRTSIFNRTAQEKLNSVDDLSKCVRIARPSPWAVFGAIAALVAGLLCWGLFGATTTSISTNSVTLVNKDDKTGEESFRLVCFLTPRELGSVHMGDTARISGVETPLKSISETPLSKDELQALFEEQNIQYLASGLIRDGWMYMVELETGPLEEATLYVGRPIPTTITTERISPLEALFKD